MAATEEGPKGLAGWLILPAIGLLVLPIRLGIVLYTNFLPIFQQGDWAVLTTPGSGGYHPLWGPYLLFEIAGNSAFIVFDLALLYFFFSKSFRLPRLMVIFYIANLAFVVLDFFLGDLIPAIAAQPTDPAVAGEIARAVVGTLIWVPYFLVSKRVKNTFVRPAAVAA